MLELIIRDKSFSVKVKSAVEPQAVLVIDRSTSGDLFITQPGLAPTIDLSTHIVIEKVCYCLDYSAHEV